MHVTIVASIVMYNILWWLFCFWTVILEWNYTQVYDYETLSKMYYYIEFEEFHFQELYYYINDKNIRVFILALSSVLWLF